jgi:hypothetical protein
MAIQINGTTVIDNSRNLANIPQITFGDASVQTTAASKEEYLNHFIDNASGTWVIPAGVTKFIVFIYGGGAGGNARRTQGDSTQEGFVSEPGGICVHEYTVVSGSLSYTLGAGSAGQTSENSQSAAGGDSTATYNGVVINAHGGKSGVSSGGNIHNGDDIRVLGVYAKPNPKGLYIMMVTKPDFPSGGTTVAKTWDDTAFTHRAGSSGYDSNGGYSGGIAVLW